MPTSKQVAGALSWLVDMAHRSAPDELPAMAAEAARQVGASNCRLYLISRDQRELLPLRSTGASDDAGLGLDGTIAGRAYRLTEIVASTSDGARLWVPLVDGVERLGVLELTVATPDDLDPMREPATALAGLLAELVVLKGQYTDVFEKARRSLPMGVAAELLWRQLPPLTFATDRFVITGQLEPWHEVGGDAFDYSFDHGILHLAVFDGMGHGLGATQLASVALAAYRNSRRSGHDLITTARTIDDILGAQFGVESFVTAVLGQLDAKSGHLRLLSAAHPAPVLVRAGRPVGELHIEPGFPLGFGTRDDRVVETWLQPGDRVLLLSDGVIEARSDSGEFFGLDRLIDMLNREEAAKQSAPETLRRLIAAVLDYQHGTLQDDATLLMLQWAGDVASVLITA